MSKLSNLTMSQEAWNKYRDLLSKLSKQASDEFKNEFTSKQGRWGGLSLFDIPASEIIDFAYALVTKYSEGSTAAACMFFDELAELSDLTLPAAIPAETASIHEVAKAVNGTKKTGNLDVVSNSLGRLVKQAGQDTTLENAMRYGAEVAWIPSGDTCAFCIALASRGWQEVSKKTLKNGHAEHIHANCDCAYGVRFNNRTNYAGYDPQKYKDMYYGDYWRDKLDGEAYDEFVDTYNFHDGFNSKDNINSMRRIFYKENKEKINDQKRDAYQRSKKLNSSKAEEINVD